MQNYRLITKEEFNKILEKYNPESANSLVRKVKEFVKNNYPRNVYKVFVRVNSEYNDSYYDFSPCLLVLDKELNELSPIGNRGNLRDLFRNFTNSEGYELEEHMDDFSFLLGNKEEEIPELYLKID